MPGSIPACAGEPKRTVSRALDAGSIPACAGEPRLDGAVHECGPVYPRVCGGTLRRHRRRHLRLGLSPRVRGNQSMSSTMMGRARSIPACAGEPIPGRACPCRHTVYPRVCGGTYGPSSAPRAASGLSPRVRGNRKHRLLQGYCRGSIPACAGEPAMASLPIKRTCGLSPRVRGNPSCDPAGTPWSIPACAGEPDKPRRLSITSRVYPRVCGGTRTPPSSGLHGSIPACAGEPQHKMPMNTPLRVYPRVCGGTNRPLRDAGARSIPACAGEPLPSRPTACSKQVYPRVCGGTPLGLWTGLSPRVRGNHRVTAFNLRNDTGLSPRVRGNPSHLTATRPDIGHPRVCGGTHQLQGADRLRSIPACAGEPRILRRG